MLYSYIISAYFLSDIPAYVSYYALDIKESLNLCKHILLVTYCVVENLC